MTGMYSLMAAIREMETKAGDLYLEKIIRGFLHRCNGQEASIVGLESALTPGDEIITAYRCHGYTHTRGVSVKEIIAELAGKATGCSKGKGGSMHLYGPHYYGGNGIVGAQVPLGAGIAFTNKYNETGKICVTLYGDGAANQGQVFEAFNMAALWKLPCLFVCENNLYGMGTSSTRSSACPEYYTRGHYIPGIWVDGQNVLAVRTATQWCADYIRAGNGPLVMEQFTYRYYGHSMSDPGKSYRSAAEVKEVRDTRDPLKKCEQLALELNLMTSDEIKAIKKDAAKTAEEAVEFARSSPYPPPGDLYTHILVEQNEVVRGCDPFTSSHSS
jgi:pyruvate dehydrogenase E1 component alpha subunit